MTLRDLMRTHAKGILTDPSHLGEETLPVYGFKDGSPSRDVRAVVHRLDLEPAVPGVARQVAKLKATVSIPNDAVVGVTAVRPGDTLTLVMRLGEEPVEARITRILSQDEGMFHVEVTA